MPHVARSCPSDPNAAQKGRYLFLIGGRRPLIFTVVCSFVLVRARVGRKGVHSLPGFVAAGVDTLAEGESSSKSRSRTSQRTNVDRPISTLP